MFIGLKKIYDAIQALSESNRLLKEQISDLSKDNEQLKRQISDLSKDNEKFEKQISDLSNEYNNKFLMNNSELKALNAKHQDLLKIVQDEREWPNQNLRLKMFDVASEETARYITKKMPKVPAFVNTLDILNCGVSNITLDGAICEFGVFSGTTINHIASLLPDKKIYGFDSFKGLPEDWRTGFAKGMFATSQLPAVSANVELVIGWFSETLPKIKKDLGVCALIHIDCDLYESTIYVLEELKDQIVNGTIIVFDEYFNYPSWENNGEYLAFQEFVNKYSISYEYIGYIETKEQVAVRIL